MKKNLFFALFLFQLANSYGQGYLPGYILTTSGDTTRGLIKDSQVGKTILFKLSKKDTILTYSSTELKEYVVDDRGHYETIEINGQQFFAKIIIRGKLSLYRLGSEYCIKKDSSILLPYPTSETIFMGVSGSHRKVNNEYIGILNIALQDCKVNVMDIKYKEKDLMKVIQEYNLCHGEIGETINSNVPFTKINYHFNIAYSQDNLTILNPLFYEVQSKSRYIPVGVGVEFSSPRIDEHFSINLEMMYQNFIHQAYFEKDFAGTFAREDLIVDTKALSFSLGVRYKLLKKPNTPYINLGITRYKILSINEKITLERERNGVVITFLENDSEVDWFLQGFFFGVGYQRLVDKNLRINLELRMNGYGGFIRAENSKLSGYAFNNSCIILGLTF